MNGINWDNVFDKIWCIHFVPYKERFNAINNELSRVGIVGSSCFEWHYTISNYWNKFLVRYLFQNKLAWALKETALYCPLEHYQIIKKSYEFGYKRILIIEDDIRFLKDLEKVKETIENIPENADIALFDYFIHCTDDEFQSYKSNKVNQYFGVYDKLMSTSCYMLSRTAMEKIIPLYEKFLLPSDMYTSFKAPPDLLKVFSLDHIACQYSYSISDNNTGGEKDSIDVAYQRENLDYSNY